MNLVELFRKLSNIELAILTAYLEEVKGESLKQTGLALFQAVFSSNHRGLLNPEVNNKLFNRVKIKAMNFIEDFDQEQLVDRLKRTLRRRLDMKESASDELLSSNIIQTASGVVLSSTAQYYTFSEKVDAITEVYFDGLFECYKSTVDCLTKEDKERAAFKLETLLNSLELKRKNLLMNQFNYEYSYTRIDGSKFIKAISKNKSKKAILGWGKYGKKESLKEAMHINYALEASYYSGYNGDELINSYLHFLMGYGSQSIVPNSVNGAMVQLVLFCSCVMDDPCSERYEKQIHFNLTNDGIIKYEEERETLLAAILEIENQAAKVANATIILEKKQKKYDKIAAKVEYDGKVDDLYDLELEIRSIKSYIDEERKIGSSKTDRLMPRYLPAIAELDKKMLNFYPNIHVSFLSTELMFRRCDYYLLRRVERFFLELLETEHEGAMAIGTKDDYFKTKLKSSGAEVVLQFKRNGDGGFEVVIE